MLAGLEVPLPEVPRTGDRTRLRVEPAAFVRPSVFHVDLLVAGLAQRRPLVRAAVTDGVVLVAGVEDGDLDAADVVLLALALGDGADVCYLRELVDVCVRIGHRPDSDKEDFPRVADEDAILGPAGGCLQRCGCESDRRAFGDFERSPRSEAQARYRQ